MAAKFGSKGEVLKWLAATAAQEIHPGLERMRWVLERLGNPERRLKFIHIAGTNGKGSTAALIASALMQAGYDVGRFTSPSMGGYTDQICFNGAEVSERELCEVAAQVREAVEAVAQTPNGALTSFELTTVLALQYYCHVSFPYYVVWETGLGGRFDATNVVVPLVSVITSIGRDHTQWLGDTLAEIAAEKAGIIKPGVPVVAGQMAAEALDVLRQKAVQTRSTLYEYGKDYRVERLRQVGRRQVFDFVSPFRRTYEALEIALAGEHQVRNAAAALMTWEVLRQYLALVFDDEQLRRGLSEASWPGRLEEMAGSPLVLLDGAHNPEGAEALAVSLTTTYKYRKLHFMMGMLAGKNHSGYFRHILPIVDTLILTEPNWHKKASAADLAAIARTMLAELGRDQVEVIIEPDWKTAFERTKELTAQDDLAVVSGTLYLMGDIRSWIKHQSDSEKGW